MATNNSWNQQITAADTAITLNSGTNAVGISTDASATTISIANGSAAKAVTLGSTNGTSSLALQCGTNNFSLASASGSIITAQAAGQLNYPLQPVFSATTTTSIPNVTGDGTNYQIIPTVISINVGSGYNSSTGLFTAPVTGKYFLSYEVGIYNMGTAHTVHWGQIIATSTSISAYDSFMTNPFAERVICIFMIANMTAGNTAGIYMDVSGSTKTVGVTGTSFSGYLIA